MRFSRYVWTAGARKHGISREQVRHVVEHCGLVGIRPPEIPRRPDETVLFLGDDPAGQAIEVLGVLIGRGELRVIHAMKMQERHRRLYEEVRRWRV